MKKRKFLSALLALPVFLAGCIHWPGIDNKKRMSDAGWITKKLTLEQVVAAHDTCKLLEKGGADFGPIFEIKYR